MKTKHLSMIVAGLIFCTVACKKSGLAPSKSHVTSLDTAVDVYVAGFIMNKTGTTAAYWKNGVLTTLGDSLSYSYTSGIAVQGNDVYVAGTLGTGTVSAVYWKNGVATKLSPGSYSAQTSCIALHGSDVYIGGGISTITSQTPTGTTTSYQPVFWKNGVATILPAASAINAITVNGNDVYIAGVASVTSSNNSTNSGSIAAYWKNGGSPVTLNYPQSYQAYYGSMADAIAVNGTDVYAAGFTGEYPPEYWTNGVAKPLRNASVIGSANGVATNGTDVFVVGEMPYNGSAQVAAYWKNNVPTILSAGLSGSSTPSLTTSSLFSDAFAIAVNGSDVYIAGNVWDNFTSYFAAYYWKNGVAVQLSGGSKGVFVSSIVVVPK
jgi:hypothetical protein